MERVNYCKDLTGALLPAEKQITKSQAANAKKRVLWFMIKSYLLRMLPNCNKGWTIK